MKDIIVRLASMKLAELKFEAEFISEKFPDVSDSFNSNYTIKDIKKMISSFFYPVDKLDIEASVNGDRIEGYWVAEITQRIPNHLYLDIIIYKPDNMSLDLFKKIMKSSGLLDVRKLKMLVKKGVKK